MSRLRVSNSACAPADCPVWDGWPETAVGAEPEPVAGAWLAAVALAGLATAAVAGLGAAVAGIPELPVPISISSIFITAGLLVELSARAGGQPSRHAEVTNRVATTLKEVQIFMVPLL